MRHRDLTQDAKETCLEDFPLNTWVKAPKRHYHKEPSKNQVGYVFTKPKTLSNISNCSSAGQKKRQDFTKRRRSQNVRQRGSPRRLPLSILNKLMDWSRNAASGSSVSGGCRAGSLFARLPTWLLFWLTSSCAWDPASAPATKHTCGTKVRAAGEAGSRAIRGWLPLSLSNPLDKVGRAS